MSNGFLALLIIAFLAVALFELLGGLNRRWVKTNNRRQAFGALCISFAFVNVSVLTLSPANIEAGLAVTESGASPRSHVVSMEKTDDLPPFKISWDIILKDRVANADLEKIARSLWRPGYEMTFMGYWLQDSSKEAGYWATTHWVGDKVSIAISGLTPDQAQKQAASRGPLIPDGSTEIGRWLIPEKFGGNVVVYRRGNSVFIHHRWPDGSGDPEEYRRGAHESGDAYRPVVQSSPTGDYWVVTKTGELEGWDKAGKIDFMVGRKVSR